MQCHMRASCPACWLTWPAPALLPPVRHTGTLLCSCLRPLLPLLPLLPCLLCRRVSFPSGADQQHAAAEPCRGRGAPHAAVERGGVLGPMPARPGDGSDGGTGRQGGPPPSVFPPSCPSAPTLPPPPSLSHALCPLLPLCPCSSCPHAMHLVYWCVQFAVAVCHQMLQEEYCPPSCLRHGRPSRPLSPPFSFCRCSSAAAGWAWSRRPGSGTFGCSTPSGSPGCLWSLR